MRMRGCCELAEDSRGHVGEIADAAAV